MAMVGGLEQFQQMCEAVLRPDIAMKDRQFQQKCEAGLRPEIAMKGRQFQQKCEAALRRDIAVTHASSGIAHCGARPRT